MGRGFGVQGGCIVSLFVLFWPLSSDLAPLGLAVKPSKIHRHMEHLTNTPNYQRPQRKRSTWTKFRGKMTKEQHIAERDRMLGLALLCNVEHVRQYDAAALKYGEGYAMQAKRRNVQRVEGSVMVSGGTWSHWPAEVREQVGKLARAAGEWSEAAYQHHRAALKRNNSWHLARAEAFARHISAPCS